MQQSALLLPVLSYQHAVEGVSRTCSDALARVCMSKKRQERGNCSGAFYSDIAAERLGNKLYDIRSCLLFVFEEERNVRADDA